jgi:hypothetical protein
MTVSLVDLPEMAGGDLSVRGLAAVDVRDSAGDLGVHPDFSAGVLDGQ